MKISNSTSIVAAVLAAFVLAGCSKEEPAPETQPAAETETVEDTAVEATEAATEAVEEEIEVVEESAAEAEDAGEAEIILAQADAAAAPVNFRFSEGTHYQRLMPTQPTVGGADKVEVAEFFWYGCGHCYQFEPTINEWDANKPANARFVRVPATWNRVLQVHAQLYYTEQVLVRNGVITDPHAFRQAVFEEYHLRNNRLVSVDAIQNFFARFGVSESDFENAWNSFEVSQKLRVASDLERRYGISAVPTVIVNGKYRTGLGENVRDYPQLIEVIDELVARESAR